MGWKGCGTRSYVTLFVTVLTSASVAAPAAAQEAPAADRIYARVVTAAGAVHEGFLDWGGDEATWGEFLNGDKELPYRNVEDAIRLGARQERDRERSIEFLGFRITWDEDDDIPSAVQSGVRFGHLESLVVLDDRAALLTLKGGHEVEFDGGSSDIGSSLDGLVVDTGQGDVELRWRDIDVVEFLSAPAGATPSRVRLHGTVTDRNGNAFTGYVTWDADERFTDEILDGDEGSREREIPFGRIAAIERDGPSASRVTLVDGTEMVLTGSNDVDDDNRGIAVADPTLGAVTVEWDDFESLRLHPPERATPYDAFDGGLRLYGTVVDRDGREVTGWLRWDNDEEFGWEILDGSSGDVEFDVELARVARIERITSRSAQVTLRDGRSFELEGSNDVDRGNRGIYVETEEGGLELIRWEDFAEVVFAAEG